MKTTIDIADPLFEQAKQLASRHSTTFKAIVEASLRRYLEQESSVSRPFKLRDCSVGGNGVHEGIVEGDWTEISRLVYEGRGA
jgi:hypothetical protein